ncbi:MAG: hypothetical protein ACRCTE_09385 [Cellulosilyticaceae bacterium]
MSTNPKDEEEMKLVTRFFTTENKTICRLYNKFFKFRLNHSREQLVYSLVVSFKEDADIFMAIVSTDEESKELHTLTERMSCYKIEDTDFPWAYTTHIEDEFIYEVQESLSEDESMVVLYKDPKKKQKKSEGIRYHMIGIMADLANRYEDRVTYEHQDGQIDRDKLNQRIRQINKLRIDLEEMKQSILRGEC